MCLVQAFKVISSLLLTLQPVLVKSARDHTGGFKSIQHHGA